MSKNQVHIQHLAQDLQPGLSRADFYRLSFSFLPKTRVQSLSVIASAFVKSHPCRLLQAFPVQAVAGGYQRDNSSGTWASEFIYDNGMRLDLKAPGKSLPTLDLYIKVDATHSEPVELRFECDFRLAVDSFVRLSRPALWNLPTQLTGSLHLKPVVSPASSGPSTPREEFNRRLWKENRQTRKPSTDNAAMMRPVEEEVQIVDHEANAQEGWNAYANERMDMRVATK